MSGSGLEGGRQGKEKGMGDRGWGVEGRWGGGRRTICAISIFPDIESFVTYSERYEFYDHFGRPHTDRLTALLGEEAQVGGEGTPLPLNGMHDRTADST